MINDKSNTLYPKVKCVAFVSLLDMLKELIWSVAYPRRFLDRGGVATTGAWGLLLQSKNFA
jgi:hypothetical protein